MKRIGSCLLAACLLGCMCLPAAALSLPGDEARVDVLARYTETFDENTAVAVEMDGVFTLTAPDSAVLTVTVEPGALPEGARLMVISVPQDGEAYRWFSAVLDKGRLRPYALYFIKDGERIPFDGELSLSVTAPDGMAEPLVYRVAPSGNTQKLPFETRDGRLSLTTGYETPYIVIADADGTGGVPQTGDAGMQGWTAVMGAAAMTMLALSKRRIIRKKKEDARWS